MPSWTPRPVDAPAEDLLNLADVAKLLLVSDDHLRKLIAAGEFPEGLSAGKAGRVWDWRAVAYFRLRMEMLPRLRGAAEPDPGTLATPRRPRAGAAEPAAGD